jgi:hypothetical protein
MSCLRRSFDVAEKIEQTCTLATGIDKMTIRFLTCRRMARPVSNSNSNSSLRACENCLQCQIAMLVWPTFRDGPSAANAKISGDAAAEGGLPEVSRNRLFAAANSG